MAEIGSITYGFYADTKNMEKGADKLISKFDEIYQRSQKVGESLDNLKPKSIEDIQDTMSQLVETTAREGKLLNEVMDEKIGDDIARSLKEPIQQVKNISDALNTLKQPQNILGEGGAEAVQKMGANIEKTKKQIEELKKRSEEAAKAIEADYEAALKLAGQSRSGTAESAEKTKRVSALKAEKTANMLQTKMLDVVEEKLKEAEAEYQRLGYVAEETGETQSQSAEKAAEKQTSLRQQIKDTQNAMSAMLMAARMSGDENAEAAVRSSAEYQSLAEKLGLLKDTFNDVQKQGQQLGSDTGKLQAYAGGLSGIAGAASAAQGAMGLFGTENEAIQRTMLKVQSLMAITNGLKQLDNLLNKDSAFQIQFGNKVRKKKNAELATEATLMKKNTAATVTNTGAAVAGTAASIGLAGAIRAIGVAIMNIPVIGWILAIITGIIAAISQLTNMFEGEEEAQKKAFEMEQLRWNALKEMYDKTVEQQEKYIKNLERELELAKAEGKTTKELRKLQDNLLQAKRDNANKNLGSYGMSKQEIAEIEMNIEKAKKDLEEAQKIAIDDEDKNIEYHLDGKALDEDAKDAIERLQKYIEFYEGKLKFQIKLEADLEDAKFEMKKRDAERKKEDRDAAKQASEAAKKRRDTELKETRTTEDMRLAMLADSLQKEIALAQVASRRKIEDIKNRLKTEKDLTVKARKELNDQILLEQQALANKEKALRIAANIKNIDYEQNMWEREAATQTSVYDTPDQQDQQAKDAALRKWQTELSKLNEELTGNISEERAEQIEREMKLLRKEYEHTIKTIDDTRIKKENDTLNDLLQQYGNYQEQIVKINEDYQEKINLATQKGNTALAEKLKKEWKRALKEKAADIFKTTFAKALGDKGTLQDVEEALEQVRKLAEADTYEEGLMEGVNPENFEEAKEAAKELVKELEKLRSDKGDIPIVRSLKSIKEMLNKGEIEQAIQGITNVAGMVADTIGNLGDALAGLADVTGDENLAGIASNMQKTADVISSTVSGAGAGASAGGWIGAIVGAVVGLGTGLTGAFGQSAAEIAEARQQAYEEAADAVYEGIDAIFANIDAMNSLEDAITGLDYANMAKQLQSLIAEIQKNNLDTNKKLNFDNIDALLNQNVDNMLRIAQEMVNRGILDLNNLRDFGGANSADAIKGVENAARRLFENTGNGDLSSVYYLEQWFKDREGEGRNGGALGLDASDFERLLRHNATAALINYFNEMQQQQQQLLGEISEAQRNGAGTLELYNLMQRYRKTEMERLSRIVEFGSLLGFTEEERLAAQQQLDALTLDYKEAAVNMFEAFAGQDISGIVDEWINIFEEFGTTGQLAFEKIDQSIDKMMYNMLKQQLVIKPLTERIRNMIEEAAGEDGELDQEELNGMFEGLRGIKENARDLVNDLHDAAEAMNLDLDDVTGNTMSAAIKGVSEETAGIIAGQMNAIRVHQIEMQEILQGSIAGNVETIARNSSYLHHLQTIDQRLANLENNSNYQNQISA